MMQPTGNGCGLNDTLNIYSQRCLMKEMENHDKECYLKARELIPGYRCLQYGEFMLVSSQQFPLKL